MNDAGTDTKRSRRPVVAGCAAGLVVLVLLGAGVNWAVSRGYASRSDEIARAMAARGYPASFEELVAYRNGPFDGPNGWDELQTGLGLLVSWDSQSGSTDWDAMVSDLDSGVSLSEGRIADIDHVLVENAECIEWIRRATDRVVFRCPVEFDDQGFPVVTAFSFWGKPDVWAQVGRLLQIRAIRAAMIGEREDALSSLQLLLRLGESVDDQLTGSPQSRGPELRVQAARAARVLVQGVWSSDERALVSLAELLEDAKPADIGRMTWCSTLEIEAFYHALLGSDIVRQELGNASFDSLSSVVEFAGEMGLVSMHRYTPLGEDDCLRAREQALRAVEVSGQPFAKSLQTNQFTRGPVPGLDGLYIVSSGWLDVESIARREAVARTQLSATATAARIAVWRVEHGRLPSVEEYAGEIPRLRDPFDGAFLRYAIVEGGFWVYSVGANGIDEGGAYTRGFGPTQDDEGVTIEFGGKPVEAEE